MPIKYCIGRGVLGDLFVDIAANDFDALRTARRNLTILLGIEEKFEMVIENYLEYERTLFDLALADVTSRMVTASFYDAPSLVTRRLANCLSLGRMYEDQVHHDLSAVYSRKSDISSHIVDTFNVQSKQLLGYRAMREVRNCLQHRTIVLDTLTFRGAWEEYNNNNLRHHRVSVQINVQALRDDRKVGNLELVKELEQTLPANDMSVFLRQYVEGLSCVHREIRIATQENVEGWKRTLRDIIRRYNEACTTDTNVVVALKHDEETTLEEVYVVGDVIDRFEEARRKRVPIGLSRAYASNAPGQR